MPTSRDLFPDADQDCKEEKARPLVKKLKSIIKSVLVQYHKVRDNLIRVTGENDKLQQENDRLYNENGNLTRENAILKEQNQDYRRLKKQTGRNAGSA